jgi:hypothetical protein
MGARQCASAQSVLRKAADRIGKGLVLLTELEVHVGDLLGLMNERILHQAMFQENFGFGIQKLPNVMPESQIRNGDKGVTARTLKQTARDGTT